jgi:hypothetical protein
MQTQNMTHDIQLPASLTPRTLDPARVLIVSDNDSETERLKTAFRDAGLTSESADSMTVGCALANPAGFR